MKSPLLTGAEVRPYASAPLAGVDLDLRDNTNPWGAPPSASRSIGSIAWSLAAYPSVNAEPLVAELAARIGVSESAVVVGCGSDDLLDASFRAFARAGDRVAHGDPTFSMIPKFARLNGVEPVAVPLRTDGSADVAALLEERARMVYVASPNNPTGSLTAVADLAWLAERHDGVVLVDEAYAEFAEAQDLRAAAASRENLVVFRTFSKAWGLAGLRIGYAVTSPALAAALTTARGPYRVTTVAQEIVIAALRNDGEWVAARARDAVMIRQQLERALSMRRGVRVVPSHGNFVFATVSEPAREIALRFQARGIGVRAFEGLPSFGDAIRFGVVSPASLERLLSTIDEVFQ